MCSNRLSAICIYLICFILFRIYIFSICLWIQIISGMGPRRKVLRNPNNLPYIYFFPWYNWIMNHPFHCLKLLIFPSKQREIFFVYTARKGLNLRYNQTPTSFLPNKIEGLIRKIRIKHHWLLQFCFCFFLLIEKRYHSFMLVSHF